MVLAAFLSVLSSGNQEVTTETQPDGTGEFYSAYSLSAGGALAYNFSDRFSAGLAVKNVHEDIYGLTQDAVAFDMGTNYHEKVFGREVRLSFAISNLGTNLTFGGDKLRTTVDPEDIYPGTDIGRLDGLARRETGTFKLPTSFHISGCAEAFTTDRYRLLAAVEFSENSNQPVSLACGTELTRAINPKSVVALRGGWTFQQDETGLTSSEKLRGLSLGGGFSYQLHHLNIRADYAYRNLGILSANHTYGLTLVF